MTCKTILPFRLLLVFTTLFLGSGCGLFTDSPGTVAEHFLVAIDQQRFDDAQKYATPETKKMLDVLAGFARMTKKKEKSEMHRFEIVSEQIDGETAIVTYRVASEEGQQTLNLVMIEGKWLVSLSKNDLPPKDASELEEEGDDNHTHDEGETHDHAPTGTGAQSSDEE